MTPSTFFEGRFFLPATGLRGLCSVSHEFAPVKS